MDACHGAALVGNRSFEGCQEGKVDQWYLFELSKFMVMIIAACEKEYHSKENVAERAGETIRKTHGTAKTSLEANSDLIFLFTSDSWN